MEMAVPTESSRWRRFQTTEASASRHASASGPRYRLAADVGILAILVAELELSEIERKIFLADVVIGADDSAFKQRPEALNVIGVDFAAHVLAATVAHYLMWQRGCQQPIAAALIRGDQRNPISNGLADKSVEGRRIGVFDNLADHAALARDRTDDSNLVAHLSASDVSFLIPVAVFVLATDEGFVHFDDAHELLEIRIVHRGAQAMAHIPSCLVRGASDLPLDLERAHALLTVEHLPDDFKPCAKRIFSILENRATDDREAIGVALATFLVRAFPLPRLRQLVNRFRLAAARAANAARPTALHQELAARIFGRKSRQQFFERHHGRNIHERMLSVKCRIIPKTRERGSEPERRARFAKVGCYLCPRTPVTHVSRTN
jgi:hypothetical protein